MSFGVGAEPSLGIFFKGPLGFDNAAFAFEDFSKAFVRIISITFYCLSASPSQGIFIIHNPNSSSLSNTGHVSVTLLSCFFEVRGQQFLNNVVSVTSLFYGLD